MEFLSLKGGCIGSSECTLVKMPQCWKFYVMAYFFDITIIYLTGGKPRNYHEIELT